MLGQLRKTSVLILITCLYAFTLSAHNNTSQELVYSATTTTKAKQDYGYNIVSGHEQINPFTGGLSLQYLDVDIAISPKLSMQVYRNYKAHAYWGLSERSVNARNDKAVHIYNSPGWSIHPGTIIGDTHSVDKWRPNPIFVHADGTVRELIVDDTKPDASFITSDNWRATHNGGVFNLIDPNGTSFEFVNITGAIKIYKLVKVEDVHGNWIKYNYNDGFLQSAQASDGTELHFNYTKVYREHEFRYTLDKISSWTYILTSISHNGEVLVSYDYSDHHRDFKNFYFMLNKVVYPNSRILSYDYATTSLALTGEPTYHMMLHRVRDSINNASTTYEYQLEDIYNVKAYGVGASIPGLISEPVLKRKTHSEGDISSVVDIAPSHIESDAGKKLLVRTIKQSDTNHAAITTTYKHYFLANNQLALLGKPYSIEVTTDTGQQRLEEFNWSKKHFANKARLSDNNFAQKVEDDASYKAELVSHKIVQDDITYQTNYSDIDSYGNVCKVEEFNNHNNLTRSTNYTYALIPSRNIVHNLASKTVNANKVLRNTYNEKGDVIASDKFGVKESYSYDAKGNVAKRINGRGFVTNFSSYRHNIPEITIYPDGSTVKRTINWHGDITAERDGNGNTTHYEYLNDGSLKKITYPLGSAVDISYGSDGSVMAQRGNLVTKNKYDASGNLLLASVTDTATNTERIKKYSYDYLGRLIFASDYNTDSGHYYDYDSLNRVTKSCYPSTDACHAFLYQGNTETVISPLKQSVTIKYHAYGNPAERAISKVANYDTVTEYERDIFGKPVKISQGGRAREYIYNDKQQLAKVVQPETGHSEYQYDTNGNVVYTQTSSLGRVVKQYDSNNRLIALNYTDGSPDVFYSYDNNSNVSKVSKGQSTRSYSYDANNNLINESLNVPDRSFAVAYSYNSNDSLTAITYPDNEVVTLNPNAFGQATIIGQYIKNATYNKQGNLTELSYANGVAFQLNYDAANRPASYSYVGNGAKWGQRYNYDLANNLTRLENLAQNTSIDLGYDQQNRLISARASLGVINYSYNTAGDIIAKTQDNKTDYYNYNNQGLDSNLSYDAAGNISKDANNNYQFGLDGNLSLVINQHSINVYEYDGEGHRYQVNGDYSFYSKAGDLLYEESNVGKISKHYYFNGKKVLQSTDNILEYIHPDYLGSPIAATDANGAILWAQEYYPYGTKVDSPETHNNTWYSAKVADDTGLLYFGARYYNPEIGRFISIDPVDVQDNDPDTFNRYTYANNNPYRYKDPDGRSAVEFFHDLGNGFDNGLRIGIGGRPGYTYSSAFWAGTALGEASWFVGGEILGASKLAGRSVLALRGAEELSQNSLLNNSSHSLKSKLNLQKSMASQSQMSENGFALAGYGTKVPFRGAERTAKEFGGEATDWAKMSSSSFVANDGMRLETHWIQNMNNGFRAEFKTKMFP